MDPEAAEAMRLMAQENEKVIRSRSPRPHSDSPARFSSKGDQKQNKRRNRPDRPKTGVNFGRARQSQRTKAMGKSMRRFNELKDLVELDFITIDLFDLPPMSEYDLYIKSFGGSNAAQTSTQTGQDANEVEIQTEEVAKRTRWTQEPPTDLKGCGRDQEEADISDEEEEEDALAVIRKTNAVRLGNFISSVGPAFSAVLEENLSLYGSAAKKGETALRCADSVTSLVSNIPLFAGRSVVHSAFSTVQPQFVLTAYSPAPTLSGSDETASKGFVALWNLSDSSSPQKILICESNPTCVCFGPDKASLAFAATEDGTFLVWDLREGASPHKTYTVGGNDYVLRHPTYSTDGIQAAQNHETRVVAIAAVFDEKSSRSTGSTGTCSRRTALRLVRGHCAPIGARAVCARAPAHLFNPLPCGYV